MCSCFILSLIDDSPKELTALDSCTAVPFSMFPMLTSNIITGDVLLFRLSAWTALIFTSTAEYGDSSFIPTKSIAFIDAAVMILRVWALYGRSRLTFGVLHASCIIEITAYDRSASSEASEINTRNGSMDMSIITSYTGDCVTLIDVVVTTQATILLSCVVLHSPHGLFEIIDTTQIALGALMCLLIATQLIKESLKMYAVTKRFQPNCYMNVLLREGMTYPLVSVHVLSLFGSPTLPRDANGKF